MHADDPVVMRPAGPDDAEAVATIWREGWHDGHLGHVPEALVAARTPESFAERVAERVADTVVAVVGDEVAGFVMVIGNEVEQVYVSGSYRGTGVASALLDRAERLVAANGHERAWLAVAAGNVRARRFYERCGWTDDGIFDYPAATAAGPCHRYGKRVGGV